MDGNETGQFRPGELYTIGVEPGEHQLRAVRTDRAAQESVTVTATGPPEEKGETDRVSLGALVWQGVVSTSTAEPTDTEIDFEEGGMGGSVGGSVGGDHETVRLDG